MILNILLQLVFEIEQVLKPKIELQLLFLLMMAKLKLVLDDVLHQIFVE
jgi:hypothetical protein